MMFVVEGTAIFAAGVMVGLELAIATIVPKLTQLVSAEHAPEVSKIAGLMGKIMPVWYFLVLGLSTLTAYLEWSSSQKIPVSLAASVLSWILSIVLSLAVLVPLNNRISSWKPETLPSNWRELHDRWVFFHKWRVACLFLAFAGLIYGSLHA
jgi:hypothetical protein